MKEDEDDVRGITLLMIVMIIVFVFIIIAFPVGVV